MSDVSSMDVVVLSKHKYRWTVFEIVSMIALPLVPLAFVLLSHSDMKAMLLPALGLIGSGTLFYVGRHRKRESAVVLVDEGGVWRVLRGPKGDGQRTGDFVTVAEVNDVHLSDRPGGFTDVVLVVRDADGETAQTLRIEERLLAAPEVTVTIRPLMSKHLVGRSKERGLGLLPG